MKKLAILMPMLVTLGCGLTEPDESPEVSGTWWAADGTETLTLSHQDDAVQGWYSYNDYSKAGHPRGAHRTTGKVSADGKLALDIEGPLGGCSLNGWIEEKTFHSTRKCHGREDPIRFVRQGE